MKRALYLVWLKAEFDKRKRRNQNYSWRAFARSLGISSGTLSEIMARERPLSPRVAQRISVKLKLSQEQSAQFLDSVRQNPDLKTSVRLVGVSKKIKVPRILESQQLDAVADCRRETILTLFATTDFSHDPAWIAKRVGISKAEASRVLEDLLAAGLIRKDKARLMPADKNTDTTTDIPSKTLQAIHKQKLQLGMDALAAIPVRERDFSSMVIAVDTSKIPQLKKMLRDFRHQVGEFLEAGNCTEVFALNFQFFPLTRKGP